MNKKAILLYPFNNIDTSCIGYAVEKNLKNKGYEVATLSMLHKNGQYRNDTELEAIELIKNGFIADFIFATDYGPWPGIHWNKNNFPNIKLVYETGDEPQAMRSHLQKAINSDIILTPDYRCQKIYTEKFNKNAIWFTQFAIKDVYLKNLDMKINNTCVTTCGIDRGEVSTFLHSKLGNKFINKRIYGPQHADFLSSGTIVFQESKHKEITRRVFEGGALGRLVIADRPNEETNYKSLLIEGEEVIWYDSKEDALEKIEFFLTHTEKAKEIGTRAQKRIEKEHTCESRISKFLIEIEREIA
jgi:hypothetical protein